MERKKQYQQTQEQLDRMMDEGLGAGRTGSYSGKIVDEEVVDEQASIEEKKQRKEKDVDVQGRHRFEMDVDRMVNEGLGGGRVGDGTGLIEESHVDEEAKEEK